MKPELSVILPTRNRAADLGRALASIQAQTLDAGVFEVIVVDNGSTDGTRAVAEGAAARMPNLRCVVEPVPGLLAGRHRGLAEAAGDILIYIDDDIEARPEWLAALRDAFGDPGVVLAGGPNLPVFDGPLPSWLDRLWNRQRDGHRLLHSLSILDLGRRRRAVNPHFVWGCNFAIRRQTLMAAGGFHPDGLPAELLMRRGDGESWVSEYVRAAGLVACYEPRATVLHRVPAARMSIDFFMYRAYTQGLSDSYTVLRERARRDGRIRPPPPVADRRAAGLRALYMLKRAAGRLPAAGVARIPRDLHASAARGYVEHRRAVAGDPALRQWIERSSYLT